ncbi:MAG: coenzyme F420-0:L-glutamate ligase [Eubacteriales bacterium]|nr:coenzyme F420-0:L-glutamate ligase [Eubacteriales bacterium]
MERRIGTVARGLRAPIIKDGDDLRKIVVDTVMACHEAGDFTIRDRDVLAVTESVLARAQKNFVTIEQMARDIKSKVGGDTIGVVFPILSRNRFAICLQAIAKAAKKVVVMLSYPSDEVGNHLVALEKVNHQELNPYVDLLSHDEFKNHFGDSRHPFTGMNYPEYYTELINGEGAEAEIIFCNNPKRILEFADSVICADIHTRFETKKAVKEAGGKTVIGLDDIMNESIDGSGHNPQYGILGCNRSTDRTVKLFPINCQEFVEGVQADLKEKTGKTVEVMIYGDGAFKDPVGKIWELADPVVSPGYTSGLEGQPHELKLKYLADNEFADLRGAELQAAVEKKISEKEDGIEGQMGTTPRQLTDLLGSYCDLTSGSGDKGTPLVYIQGYFDVYTDK